MSIDPVVAAQLDFFAKSLSGCAFAAMAARNPSKFEWGHRVVTREDEGNINAIVAEGIEEPSISTLSLIFPHVATDADLDSFLPTLDANLVYLHEKLDTADNRCFRFRARVGEDSSFVSGFGPFECMPKTRRAPYTSIVMRVKPRPQYDWHLKEPEEGIIHVADMDMKGVADRNLQRMWRNSFLTTAGILGKKPDQESAAKTTFVIPLQRAANIAL